MGFLASSCSFTRFRVIDPVPDELWAEIPQLLKKGAILDIDETTDSQADGWVSFDDYLDTTWQAGQPQIGAYIAFSLRVDTRRIPAGVVRKHLVLALKREKAENEKNGKKFISRERRKELKEQVQISLRSASCQFPTSSTSSGTPRTTKYGSPPRRQKCSSSLSSAFSPPSSCTLSS